MPVGPDMNRNRFGRHPETPEILNKKKLLSETYEAFGNFLDAVLPDGRAKSTTATWLQHSFFWANFAVDELSPVSELAPETPEEPTLF